MFLYIYAFIFTFVSFIYISISIHLSLFSYLLYASISIHLSLFLYLLYTYIFIHLLLFLALNYAPNLPITIFFVFWVIPLFRFYSVVSSFHSVRSLLQRSVPPSIQCPPPSSWADFLSLRTNCPAAPVSVQNKAVMSGRLHLASCILYIYLSISVV